ncbi:hypothetical protein H0H92_002945 [Tricholoma furcatifolium]|nr:hypothetical protein H0H92_002945 [Tricholoma furcatifolium]
MDHPVTTASWLRDRIRYAGQSVYWQTIFQNSPDPTFVLLTFVWHALYAWDEALEHLYNHICWLETKVISTSDMALTQELHIIRAHHLHYSSLLENFEKTVKFIKETYHPGMDSVPEAERKYSAKLMERECNNLLSEIDRLDMGRKMQDKRLKNVMNLVFSSVNIGDSKRMQQMTEAAVKDSAACSQGVFGMNLNIIVPGTLGTLPHYFAVALPLTFVTVWVVIAFQSKWIYPKDTPLWKRFGWPVYLAHDVYQTKFGKKSVEEIPLSVKG